MVSLFAPGELEFVHPADSRSAIVRACVECWFGKAPSGLPNWGDCSGFLKSVQARLGLVPFTTDANGIADEIRQSADWQFFGTGSEAARTAANAAEAGRLALAAWKAPPGKHGHVAIITSRIDYAGRKPEQQAIGAWGQYGGSGRVFGKMSESFGSGKHAAMVYAAYNGTIVPGLADPAAA